MNATEAKKFIIENTSLATAVAAAAKAEAKTEPRREAAALYSIGGLMLNAIKYASQPELAAGLETNSVIKAAELLAFERQWDCNGMNIRFLDGVVSDFIAAATEAATATEAAAATETTTATETATETEAATETETTAATTTEAAPSWLNADPALAADQLRAREIAAAAPVIAGNGTADNKAAIEMANSPAFLNGRGKAIIGIIVEGAPVGRFGSPSVARLENCPVTFEHANRGIRRPSICVNGLCIVPRMADLGGSIMRALIDNRPHFAAIDDDDTELVIVLF